jgi:hypothetical protein
MLDFIDMTSWARYLFAPNTLPLANLLLKSNLKALESLFSFQSMQMEADVNQFRLTAGMGEIDGKPVPQLVIDAVSATLGVVGDNSDLCRTYGVLCEFLAGIDPKKRMKHPKLYTTTYQTQSTVQLSLPHERLIAPELVKFLQSRKNMLKPNASSSAEIYLSNLSFQVKYASSNDIFSFVPKMFTIEPRAGADIKENMYFVLTPTDSDAHRMMIQELEKAMTGEE